MPIYRERMDHRSVHAVSLDEMWSYVDSRDAQVELDPRIHRIDVVEGAWGEPGCRMVVNATLSTGAQHTSEMEILEVDRPAGYSTRTHFPEGVTIGTHRFREVDGGTEWHHVIEITTRRLNALEYAAVMLTRRQRRRRAQDDHAEESRILATALAAMRERRRDSPGDERIGR